MPWKLRTDNSLFWEDDLDEARVKELIAEDSFEVVETKLKERYNLDAKVAELQVGVSELPGTTGTN